MGKSLIFHFLDVGQGDGTLIECPGGELVLVDLGSKKNGEIAGKDAVGTIVEVLKQHKTNKIDYLFLTHGDGDHYNLITSLMKGGVKFEEVYWGGALQDYGDKELRDAIWEWSPDANGYRFPRGKFYEGFAKEDRFELGSGAKCHLLAVNVKKQHNETQKNAGSLVLMFEYGGNKAILMGDAEPSTENFILNTFKDSFLKATLLKLAHHGSAGSNTEVWLETVQPKIVVASGDQKWGHPYKDTIERVKSVTSLYTADVHTYVQGEHVKSKNDYDWKTVATTDAIFTNLYKIEGEIGKEWKAWGTTWTVYFNDNSTVSSGHTFGPAYTLWNKKGTPEHIPYDDDDE